MTAKTVIVFYIYLQGVLTSELAQKFPHVQFVKAGEAVTIICNKTSDKSYANWQWYKEKEDGGLQDVARSTCLSSAPSSPSERIVPKCKEKQLAVEIKNAERSDSGVYYCSEPGLDQTFYAANTLIVTDPNQEEPTLTLLAPVAQQNADSGTMVLLCIALNWSNKWSLLKWSIDEKELDGWLTLDPDGSLRNLIFLPTSDVEKAICYIKNLQEGRNISAHYSTVSKYLTTEDDQNDQSQCYIVLYVGLGFAVLLLVIHQIILAKRRGSVCKKHPNKQTRPERAVRFRPEDEMVTYAPVKG
ncbi:uncharacterized protein LOC120920504 [Rana temporaria]|uniref:uncharacterized protein LOC120920504 n=1 Tax=Rana temporaria TaxID=8407 RepID=UPI001AADC40F|nr:uncharacterized protein LOC120920504 [Rana temporaria]